MASRGKLRQCVHESRDRRVTALLAMTWRGVLYHPISQTNRHCEEANGQRSNPVNGSNNHGIAASLRSS
jgi:hypothetical protein